MNEEIIPDEADIIEEVAEETEEQPAVVEEQPKVSSEEKDRIKLLAQRNAAKARADAAEARVKELEPKAQRVDELEEIYTKTEIEKEERDLKDKFYSERPNARELESLIDAKVAEGHSYDDAFKIVAADNKPELLVEEAVMNKVSGGAKMTGVAKPVTDDTPKTPAEIVARQNEQAKTERLANGGIR